MLNYMMQRSRQVALLLAFLMAFSSVAPAAERIVIGAHKCGPMAMLKAAGHDVNLLPFLQHKDGQLVKPSEYRSLSDSELYLAADAEPDAAKTKAAIAAEVKQFGAVKITADCAKGNCADVDQLKKQVDEAVSAINQLRGQANQANRVIETQKREIAKLKSNQGYSFGWLLVAIFLALAIGVGAGYKLAQYRYPAEYETLKQERDEAKELLANAVDFWNDPGKVEARLAELRAPLS